MIQVEEAAVYFLKPVNALDPDYDPYEEYTVEQIEANPDLVFDNALVVGSKHVLNEVAVFMEQDDIIATTGSAGIGGLLDRCVIITDLSRARCKEIIRLGKENYDRKLKKAMELESPPK